MTTPLPRVFRMAGWVTIFTTVASVLVVAAGVYPLVVERSPWYHALGVFLIVFGISGFLDIIVSRIVIDEHEIHLISLVRHRRYPRTDFESAKVDGGTVSLKKRAGGWLVLPDTGRNTLAVRNTIHAWIKSSDS